jgi:molybdopterin-guanine dinucleotide biosynthesis protein A
MVMHDGFPQPLCALYRSDAYRTIKDAIASGERKVIRWASNLDPVYISQDELKAAGLDPRCFMGANTPEELTELLID